MRGAAAIRRVPKWLSISAGLPCCKPIRGGAMTFIPAIWPTRWLPPVLLFGQAAGVSPARWLFPATARFVWLTAFVARPSECLIWDAGSNLPAADAVLGQAEAEVAAQQGRLIVLSPFAGDADYAQGRRLTPVLEWGADVPAGLSGVGVYPAARPGHEHGLCPDRCGLFWTDSDGDTPLWAGMDGPACCRCRKAGADAGRAGVPAGAGNENPAVSGGRVWPSGLWPGHSWRSKAGCRRSGRSARRRFCWRLYSAARQEMLPVLLCSVPAEAGV